MGNAPPRGVGFGEHRALLPRADGLQPELRQSLLEDEKKDEEAMALEDDEKKIVIMPPPPQPHSQTAFDSWTAQSQQLQLQQQRQRQHEHAIAIAARGGRGDGWSSAAYRSSTSASSASLSLSSDPPLTPYQSTEPVDVFVSVFSFLTQADLAHAACVSKRWACTAYDPSLWRSIHLCHRYNRVDDRLIALLLTSGRFPYLQHLCLDRCAAVTDATLACIHRHCPRLHFLSLVNCFRLTTEGILAFAAAAPQLRRLELIGASTAHEEIVRGLEEVTAQSGHDMELGFFMMEYAAKEGLRLTRRRGGSVGSVQPQQQRALLELELEEQEEERKEQSAASSSSAATAAVVPSSASAPKVAAVCRHSRSVADNPSATACWGSVSGRLVLSSSFYHVPGNYPCCILFSCEQHSETDLSDARFARCANCEHLFFPSSMYSEMICNFCFDSENLSSQHNWLSLSPASIRDFGLSQVVGKTIRIAERKNLPVSLLSYRASECRLDYTLPDAYEDIKQMPDTADDDDEAQRDDSHDDDDEEKKEDDRSSSAAAARAAQARSGWLVEEEEEKGSPVPDDDGSAGGAADAASRSRRGKGRGARKRRSRGQQHGRRSHSRTVSPSPAQPLLDAAAASSSAPSAGRLDSTRVPLTTFLSQNAVRLDRTVAALQSHLRAAYAAGCTRALLVLDDNENIEVLADSRVIADGLEGENHLKLVTLIWQRLLFLLYPLLLLFVLSAAFSPLFYRLLYPVDPYAPYAVISRNRFIADEGSPWGDLNATVLLVMGALLAVLLAVAVFLFCRYRRHFEWLFRKFLALDIFAIFSFGSLAIVVTAALVNRLPLDFFTLSFLTLNVAAVCLYSLYFDVSSGLHTVCIVYLNGIMAFLLSGALRGPVSFWLPFSFCLLFALLDLLSELRPNLRILPPLLVPDTMIVPTKPAILLSCNSIYIRPGELMWYGLMVTFLSELSALMVGGVFGLWVLLVCVLPFVRSDRRWRRPLPLMFLWCSVVWWQYDQRIRPARFASMGIAY